MEKDIKENKDKNKKVKTNTEKTKKVKENKYKYYEETIISGTYPIVLSIWEGSKDKLNIIFLPGTMGYPQTYNAFLEPLSKLGYNIIGINFVSHGKSPRTKETFTADDLIENTIDTITYVNAKFGDRIILLGHSQGGIIASKVASIDPRIKAVLSHNVVMQEVEGSEAVVNINVKTTPVTVKIVQGLAKMAAKIMPKKQLKATDYISNVDECIEEHPGEFDHEIDPYALQTYPLTMVSSLFCLDTKYLTDGSIKMPFYLLAAKVDEIFPYEYMKNCYKAINSKEKHFVPIDCDRHMSLTHCPDIAIKTLVEIFDKY